MGSRTSLIFAVQINIRKESRGQSRELEFAWEENYVLEKINSSLQFHCWNICYKVLVLIFYHPFSTGSHDVLPGQEALMQVHESGKALDRVCSEAASI